MPPDSEDNNTTIGVENCLREMAEGKQEARDHLIRIADRRLRRLTQTMLRDHPSLLRWEETDDVYQRGVVRLWQALGGCQPRSAVQFYRLAATVLRRELIDLARHYFGPEGMAAHHATPIWSANQDERPDAGPEHADGSTWDSAKLQTWTEFHQEVESLPEELKATFDLLWYQGLPQSEAAEVLGISKRTLERRWHEARMEIYRRLNQ